MIPISNSKLNNRSLFRKINASFKFLIFVFLVLSFFIPVGFFGQIIITIFMIGCLGFAKLTKRTYLNLLKTFLVMVGLFILINWITIKEPLTFYNSTNGITGIGPFLNVNAMMQDPGQLGYTDKNIYLTNILGNGHLFGPNKINELANQIVSDTKEFTKVTKWLSKFDVNEINRCLDALGGQTDLNKAILYVLNNDILIDGIEYKSLTISHIPAEWMNKGLVCNLQGVVLYTTKWYSIGYGAFFRSINIALKVTLIISAAVILTGTTTPSELTNGIEKLFSPLKIIRFPANECAQILSIGIRFIPTLLSESKRILNAQASRGLDFYNGGLWTKIRSLISLIIPMFTISINRSYELGYAMEARGYNPRAERTKYRRITISVYDYLYLAISIFMISSLLFIWVFKLAFMPFGIVEVGMIGR